MTVSVEEVRLAPEVSAPIATSEVAVAEHASDASVHLDAVRGLAALTVFLGHGQGLFLNSGLHERLAGKTAVSPVSATGSVAVRPPGPASSKETLGHEAVIVFFVLSGYFVGGSAVRAARRNSFTWKRYLLQRLTRLWVALIPALILGWVLDYSGSQFLSSHQNIYSAPRGQEFVLPGLDGRLTATTFLGNVFFLQGIKTPLLGTNDSLWSLSYEFWYYLFFPLFATSFIASKRVPHKIVSAAALVALMTFCGAQISAYFLIWLLGVGVALLPLMKDGRDRRLFTGSAVLIFLACLVLIRRSSLDLYWCDLTLGIVFSGLLWTILHARQVTVGEIYRRAAHSLSNMSYTLYLVHMPCFAFLSAVSTPEWTRRPLSVQSLAMLFGVYAAVFALVTLMYYCFERNTDEIRRRIASALPGKA
jgi:peptidoglycan/LPS O-acetylase OafA/YrhL